MRTALLLLSILALSVSAAERVVTWEYATQTG